MASRVVLVSLLLTGSKREAHAALLAGPAGIAAAPPRSYHSPLPPCSRGDRRTSSVQLLTDFHHLSPARTQRWLTACGRRRSDDKHAPPYPQRKEGMGVDFARGGGDDCLECGSCLGGCQARRRVEGSFDDGGGRKRMGESELLGVGGLQNWTGGQREGEVGLWRSARVRSAGSALPARSRLPCDFEMSARGLQGNPRRSHGSRGHSMQQYIPHFGHAC